MELISPCKSAFANPNVFAEYIANQVKKDDVEPFSLYEKKIQCGAKIVNGDGNEIMMLVHKIRGDVSLPYIYSVVFLLQNEIKRYCCMMQVNYIPEAKRFQHVKHAHNCVLNITVPALLFYTGYKILSYLYRGDDGFDPMSVFTWPTNKFSDSTYFYKDAIPKWFDKLMTNQSRYTGGIIKALLSTKICI